MRNIILGLLLIFGAAVSTNETIDMTVVPPPPATEQAPPTYSEYMADR